MRLIGLMAVRNESYVLGLSARVALMWCDVLVCCLHECSDNSREILTDIVEEGGSIFAFDERGEWNEMLHRQQMLIHARALGGTHFAIIDADEILTGNLLEPTRIGLMFLKALEDLGDGQILQLPGYNLRGSLNRHHDNGIWGNRWFSTVFKDRADLYWGGNTFHHREPYTKNNAAYPLEWYQPIQQGEGGTFHLWGANERRLRSKHALYKCTERLRWPDKSVQEIELTYNDWRSPEDNVKHWPQMTEWGKPWEFADVPYSWWKPYEHLMKYLDLDQEPWQEQAVRDAVAEHGAERFRGLDLFGVA